MLITIITVCFNDAQNIEKTIKSVINQTFQKFEYIIIDGGSNDGTCEIIKKYISHIDVFISEKDNGIYNAMNKGISIAHGEWLNFMNSGDVFSSDTIIEALINSNLLSKCAFIYSDFLIKRNNRLKRIPQDFIKGKVLHQSLFYKRNLHQQYGLYIETKPYIVSDYFFFIQIPETLVTKFDTPISINDTTGISMQGTWCGYQKICVDFMFRKINAFNLIKKLISRGIKNIIIKLIK